MKNLLVLFLFFLIESFSLAQYPIQTIFKGDSVVILSLEQSESINNYLKKNQENLTKKNLEIDYLKRRTDSLENIITLKNRVISEFESKSESYKNNAEDLLDSLWYWSTAPSLIFTQYDSDSTIYVYDLSNFWLRFFHKNISLDQMTEWEYNKYFHNLTYSNTQKRSAPNLEFKIVNSKYFFDSKNIRRRKLWRYKRFGQF